jgi:NADPH:quinone reductase-like Zn-dependent oxidoreductase
MRAAWYEKQGPPREVLVVGEMPDPHPAAGEVRIRIAASGINPGDIKKRQNAFGYGMPYPRVIPHSDGAGHIDQVGEGCLLNGSAGQYGVTAHNPIGPSAPPRSTRSFRSITLLLSFRTSRRSTALALEYPASRLTGPYMWRAK